MIGRVYQAIKKKIRPDEDKIEIARMLGVRIGSESIIYDHPTRVFGSEPYLCSIGNNVTITDGVRFITHNGGLRVARQYMPDLADMDEFAPIHVGDNVLFGNNSIVMPGVNIGSNVIIGAYTLVNKSVPDNTVVGGIPVRKISTLDEWIDKVQNRGRMVPTKHMSALEKKDYIVMHFPEWFEE